MNSKLKITFVFVLLFFILLAIGCSGGDIATETVEVTRVVTETVEEEGEVIEVTRVVTETVIEEVEEVVIEEEMEEEAAEETLTEDDFPELDESGQDDFSAIGSEGAGDLPPTPEGGPKVEETRLPSEGEQDESNTLDLRAQTDDDISESSTPIASSIDETNQLSAGELDDNNNFDVYLAYLNEYPHGDVLTADVSERFRLRVLDSQNQPVLGATISISTNEEWVTQLTTRRDGTALFFPNLFENTAVSYTLSIGYENTTLTERLSLEDEQTLLTYVLPDVVMDNDGIALDILFVIDTTASMRDEINELKENIRFIATEVNNLPIDLDIQYGMVNYRDIDDAYLILSTPFTNSINKFAESLEQVSAGGGGDYPEDLHTALSEGINNFAWRNGNRVGLIFVVADAPPHLDYEQEEDYLAAIEKANEAGIKIFPIASSGLNGQGEYIFRQLAQMTNGRFIFITDDPTSPTTGDASTVVTTNSDYTVGQLDQLIINIITDEINLLEQN